jgi:hypothetical protein
MTCALSFIGYAAAESLVPQPLPERAGLEILVEVNIGGRDDVRTGPEGYILRLHGDGRVEGHVRWLDGQVFEHRGRISRSKLDRIRAMTLLSGAEVRAKLTAGAAAHCHVAEDGRWHSYTMHLVSGDIVVGDCYGEIMAVNPDTAVLIDLPSVTKIQVDDG